MEFMLQIAGLVCLTFIVLLGCLLMVWGITSCIRRTILAFQNRAWFEQRERLSSDLNDIRRWCGSEFPHTEYLVDRIQEYLRGDRAYINAEHVRFYLRSNPAKPVNSAPVVTGTNKTI